MIGSARFQNFKALKDVEITFDSRLTVLVGPNGSGKSSVLRGLDWLCQMTYGIPATELHIPIHLWHGGGEESLCIEFQENAGLSYGIRFRAHPIKSLVISPNSDVQSRQTIEWLSADGHSFRIDSGSILRPERLSSQLVGLNPWALAKPSATKVSPPEFTEQGEGLASLMAYFKLYDEPKFDQIVELFRSLIPQVRRIRIDRVKAEGETLGEGLLFDLAERKGVPASAMSDGTLYALGLIVKILDPQRPRVLLIDDMEHGFHPKAQLRLVELLRRLLDEIPDLQIIATTHSPFILDRLKWNEVRVTGLREDGSVAIARIEDHPQIDRWKDDMTPGEFWATFYENWVTEQQPTLQPA